MELVVLTMIEGGGAVVLFDPGLHVAQLSCLPVVSILILRSDGDQHPADQPQGIALLFHFQHFGSTSLLVVLVTIYNSAMTLVISH